MPVVICNLQNIPLIHNCLGQESNPRQVFPEGSLIITRETGL